MAARPVQASKQASRQAACVGSWHVWLPLIAHPPLERRAMTNQTVLDTLSQLSDNIKITFQLIGRLSKLSFQPGSTPLQGDGDVRIELAHDIRDALKQHDDTLDTLRQEIEEVVEFGTYSQRRRDSLKDRERARIAAQLARLDEDLKQYVYLSIHLLLPWY